MNAEQRGYSPEAVNPIAPTLSQERLREIAWNLGAHYPLPLTTNAVRRMKNHVARFHYLASAIDQNSLNPEYLAALEEMDNLFPDINYRVFE
jgi:predicted glycosyl hydrolase (DUF1957 family)